MERLLSTPQGLLAFSTAITIATAIAIFAFGMAPKMLVPITYATAAISASLSSRSGRHLDRH